MKKNERLKIKMNPEFCPIVVSMKLIHNILSTSGRPRAVKAAGQFFHNFFFEHPKKKLQKERALAAVEKNPVHYARQLAERRNRRCGRKQSQACLGYAEPRGEKDAKHLNSPHRSTPLPCYGRRIFSFTPHLAFTSLHPTNATSNIFYYHTNHLGSTAYVTDNNATITQGFLYAPFGEITTEYAPLWQNGTLPKYSFNAKELDEETGMYYYEARYYKPPVFTSRDPMFEKYFWMTPYAYCANNPVKYVDPSGKDGVIVIKGNQITISANVYLYGSGATKEVASQIQSDVNNKWGGNYSVSSANGNSFNVSVNINVALYGNKEKNNPFIIPESWNPLNRDNFIKIDENAKRSYVYGGDEGVWRGNGRNGKTLAEDDPAPHEVGHLLGLGDKYQDINGKSVMFKGWENNIMANGQKGIVEQRNINDILKDALKAYDEWIKNADNKGKEFRYEIN